MTVEIFANAIERNSHTAAEQSDAHESLLHAAFFEKGSHVPNTDQTHKFQEIWSAELKQAADADGPASKLCTELGIQLANETPDVDALTRNLGPLIDTMLSSDHKNAEEFARFASAVEQKLGLSLGLSMDGSHHGLSIQEIDWRNDGSWQDTLNVSTGKDDHDYQATATSRRTKVVGSAHEPIRFNESRDRAAIDALRELHSKAINGQI